MNSDLAGEEEEQLGANHSCFCHGHPTPPDPGSLHFILQPLPAPGLPGPILVLWLQGPLMELHQATLVVVAFCLFWSLGDLLCLIVTVQVFLGVTLGFSWLPWFLPGARAHGAACPARHCLWKLSPGLGWLCSFLSFLSSFFFKHNSVWNTLQSSVSCTGGKWVVGSGWGLLSPLCQSSQGWLWDVVLER
jgi:hypothetical protein